MRLCFESVKHSPHADLVRLTTATLGSLPEGAYSGVIMIASEAYIPSRKAPRSVMMSFRRS